jgi:hypothetical protein
VIRPSSLAAISPARLPARRPSVTARLRPLTRASQQHDGHGRAAARPAAKHGSTSRPHGGGAGILVAAVRPRYSFQTADLPSRLLSARRPSVPRKTPHDTDLGAISRSHRCRTRARRRRDPATADGRLAREPLHRRGRAPDHRHDVVRAPHDGGGDGSQMQRHAAASAQKSSTQRRFGPTRRPSHRFYLSADVVEEPAHG